MHWNRILLSAVLTGGCVWCLAVVQQVHSEEKAAATRPAGDFQPVAPLAALQALEDAHLPVLAKAVEAETPDFKKAHEHAQVVGEVYNLRRYHKDKADKSRDPAAAVESLLALIKAAKAKDASGVKAAFATFKDLPPAKATAAPPAYKPVGSVHTLMEVQEDYFNAVKKQVASSKPDGEKVAMDLLILSELSNVNSRQSDKPDYQGWATDVRDMTRKMAEAARKGADPAQLKTTFREIHTTCGKCHDKYQ